MDFIGGPAGSIDYTTGAVTLTGMTINQINHTYSETDKKYTTATTLVNITITAGTVYYCKNVAQSTALTQDIAGPPVKLDLTPLLDYAIIPGSVRFTWMGYNYMDRSGQIYRSIDPLTNAGIAAGTISYADGIVTLTDWGTGGGSNAIIMVSLLTSWATQQITGCTFRLPGAPIRPGSFYIQANLVSDGTTASATADLNGVISSTYMSGTVNYQTGVVKISFGATVNGVWQAQPVFAASMKYNCIVYSYIPLDASIIGIDPTRLPTDGRVPVFRAGDVAVVHNEETTVFPAATAGYVLNLGRTRLESAYVIDAGGLKLTTDKYTVDLDAGTVTLANPLDLTGYVTPLSCIHRIEDMVLLSDVQITGQLTFTRALTHDYPIDSYVSSALISGDLQADAHNIFTQQTWTGVWSDTLIGSATTCQYNTAIYPFVVSNLGAIEERWAIIFTSATQYRVVGEHVGQIAIGDINTDLAPVNPATNTPYFTIHLAGWGGGWAVGYVLRFNTAGAGAPAWAACTVLQGVPTVQSDLFRIQARGDIDRP